MTCKLCGAILPPGSPGADPKDPGYGFCNCCLDDLDESNPFTEWTKSRNPCIYCDCYDPDYEACTMPSADRSYACPLNGEVGR